MFAVSEWSTGQTRLFVEDHKLAGFLIVHGSELGGTWMTGELKSEKIFEKCCVSSDRSEIPLARSLEWSVGYTNPKSITEAYVPKYSNVDWMFWDYWSTIVIQ